MLTDHLLFETESYSLSDVHCRCARGGWSAPEWVESTRLVLPRRGVFEHSSRGRTTVAEPNRLLWFHDAQSYRIRHPGDLGDRCTVVRARPEALGEAALEAGLDPDALSGLRASTIGADLDAAHRELLLCASHSRPDPLALEEACAELLRRAILASAPGPERDRGSPNGDPGRQRRLAERARLALAIRLDRSLTLRELADTLGCSPSHLCRVFRRATGTALGEYRALLRVRSALDRLAEGEEDLTTLALDLGFYDHAHFTRTFRRRLGVPPSAWREAAAGRRLVA